MIETEISITINRKSDITLLEQTIVGNKFQFPVYIREYEFSYQINFLQVTRTGNDTSYSILFRIMNYH